jgi:hypothetical protein
VGVFEDTFPALGRDIFVQFVSQEMYHCIQERRQEMRNWHVPNAMQS